MSTATEATLASATLVEKPFSYQLPAGLMVSSFAALLLELGLTRLFSVVLFYHFAFLAISIALLGLGSGGVFAHLGKRWLARFDTRSILAWLGVINGLTIPLVLKVVLLVPVSLELSRANLLRLTAIYLASAVPFFVTGLQFRFCLHVIPHTSPVSTALISPVAQSRASRLCRS